MSTWNDDRRIDEAAEIAGLDDEKWKGLGTKRVRVLRAVVYEGPADWMRKQLGQSCSPGMMVPSRGTTITISEGPLKIVEEEAQGEACERKR